ncbi:hypothetical protein LCGC14_0390310 [marine sediment metagenome]|uniref:Uncharacterized protein n=1 Tax=marine sediment metagenome TaxID=412755 RepID=A0A0F9VLQ3_9ZZZZ
MDPRAVIFLAFICSLLAVLLFGCQTQQTPQVRKVWGQGDLPADWQGFFGEGNVARLDFIQTQTINRQGQAIAVLAERLRKLEADPNDAYEAELKRRGL